MHDYQAGLQYFFPLLPTDWKAKYQAAKQEIRTLKQKLAILTNRNGPDSELPNPGVLSPEIAKEYKVRTEPIFGLV